MQYQTDGHGRPRWQAPRAAATRCHEVCMERSRNGARVAIARRGGEEMGRDEGGPGLIDEHRFFGFEVVVVAESDVRCVVTRASAACFSTTYTWN